MAVTSINEALLEEIARQPLASFSDAAEALRLSLSEGDTISYDAISKAFYPSDVEWGSEAHKLGITRVLKSPLYSDACKEYFAATSLRDEFTLSVAGKFLTEKIIFSYLDGPQTKAFSLVYFTALMGSEHLSERIVSAVMRKINFFDEWMFFKLIPNSMVTPEVVTNWLDKVSSGLDDYKLNYLRSVATLQVKRTHPEYAEFPDEWALKVFCGKRKPRLLLSSRLTGVSIWV